MRSVLRIAVIAIALFSASARPARAQEDPRLVEVVRLAQDGQGDSARSVVSRLLAATPPTDTTYPQILYTQGLVAKTVEDMRRVYQRIAVEYAASSWADDALLRLAMLDYAAGNPTGTVKEVERIRTDYSTTSLLPVVAYWGARAYFDLRKPAEACRWLADGLARVGDNVELQNQLNYYQPRCSGVTAQAAESLPRDTTAGRAPKPPGPVSTSRPGFSVQVGAVKTQAQADQLTSQLRAAGFEPHSVRSDGLLKVRVGHFDQRSDAQSLAAKIKAKLGGGSYVVSEP